jgi:hypothetical protein
MVVPEESNEMVEERIDEKGKVIHKEEEEEESNEEHPQPRNASIVPPSAPSLPTPHSAPELCQLLSQRYILQLSPEDDALLDPLERTLRYLIPIPRYYYWEVLTSDSPEAACSIADIPWSIRLWHNVIGGADYAGTWLNRRVAQPIAAGIGLTGPRFHHVLDSMTAEELQQSRRRMMDRKRRDAERRSHV